MGVQSARQIMQLLGTVEDSVSIFILFFIFFKKSCVSQMSSLKKHFFCRIQEFPQSNFGKRLSINDLVLLTPDILTYILAPSALGICYPSIHQKLPLSTVQSFACLPYLPSKKWTLVEDGQKLLILAFCVSHKQKGIDI